MITIHNGLYQAIGFDKLHYLPEFDLTHVNVLEWDHCIMAVGVKCMGSDYRFSKLFE
jgi:starch synthase